MNNYQVKVLHGKDVSVVSINANNHLDALSQVKAKGYTPIAAKAQLSKASRLNNSKFPLVSFSQELLALLEAGLNLVEAIETLAEKEARLDIKVSLDSLLRTLHEGQSFSSALSTQSNNFPLLYIATIRASEKTGNIAEALERYVRYELQLSSLKKKVVTASIYPVLLMLIGSLVIIFLLGFVVPKFSRIYEDNATNLPWLSQLMLAWGSMIEEKGKSIFFVLILIIIVISYVVSMYTFRQWLVQMIWKLPSIGSKLKIFQLARFYRTLGMLINGGTPVLIAVSYVDGMLDKAFQQKMRHASSAIQQGQSISSAMEQSGMTTPVALRMLRVGERSGRIGDMMERVAEFYDEEFSKWIDWFTRLFEPILMLIIGLIIGVVVILLYMPIFELAGNIQ